MGCPVDHGASPPSSSSSAPAPSKSLSEQRQVSSIPRSDATNWVYPSEAQFFSAMARKNHSPQAADMKTIVPIHNEVNERAWGLVSEWERGRGGEACGGIRLKSFQGKPQQRSPKAYLNSLLGYSAPFDRHDWIVDRCGTPVRYVIDFYSGHVKPGSSEISFYIDARPALDSFDAIQMRLGRLWSEWTSPPRSQQPSHTSSAAK